MAFLTKPLFLLFLFFSLSQAEFKPKLIHLSYSKTPDKIYKNQIFTIDVKAIVAIEEFQNISTSFSSSKSSNILNKESPWERSENNYLKNRYYVKALDDGTIKLPNITVDIYLGGNNYESDTLNGKKLKVTALSSRPNNFADITANDLIIKKQKVNKYDNKSNIIVLEMKSLNGNLEDFFLKEFTKQGIESIIFTLPYTKAFYYAVIPDYMERFDFSYFNLQEQKFKTFNLNIELDEDKVSTQSDLNPTENSFDIYKITAVGILSAIFAWLYVFRKRFTYVILTMLGVGYILYLLIPKEPIYIKQNSNVYLLPTNNSTIFLITADITKAQKLKEQNGYIKVLINDTDIGWIKENDVKN